MSFNNHKYNGRDSNARRSIDKAIETVEECAAVELERAKSLSVDEHLAGVAELIRLHSEVKRAETQLTNVRKRFIDQLELLARVPT